MTSQVSGVLPVVYGAFATPNFIQASLPKVVEGNRDIATVPLPAIPDETFHILIEEWVREMYEKAKKQRPPTVSA